MGMEKEGKRSALIYLVSTIFARAVPFLLMPILTNFLSLEQYGYIGLYLVLCSFGTTYVGLRPDVYLMREYTHRADEFNTVRAAMFLLVFFSAIVFLPIGFFASIWFLPAEISAGLMISLVTVVSVLGACLRIIKTEFQIEGRPILYALMEISAVVIHSVLAVVFVLLVDQTWTSKVYAEISGVLVALGIGFILCRRKLFVFDSATVVRELSAGFRYLWPLTFFVGCFSVLKISDRVVISEFLGAEELGLYTVAYMYGMILGVVHEALERAWNPYFFRTYSLEGGRKRIYRSQISYFIFSALLYVVFIFIAPKVFVFMVDEKYASGADFIPVLALAYTFEGCRKVLCGYLYVSAKTGLLSVITVFAAVVNVLLNINLIPVYGLNGAAYSAAVGFFLMFSMTAMASWLHLRSR